MKAPLLFVLLLIFFSGTLYPQSLIINELDSDTDGTDMLEFIELKSSLPNQSLNGYIIVFYSGNGDLSYYTIDLNGYTTDANGLFLTGNADVVPTPSIIFPSNTLQNGQDAVAIYHASTADFPIGTYVTNINLIDALVYDTDDPDDPELLSILGKTVQINENEYGNKNGHSIQNNGDGTYTVGTPSPGLPNDGSTSETNFRITISSSNETYTEGDQFDITFTSDVVLDQDLTINLSLVNGSFNANDFTADNSLLISSGSTTSILTVSLVDDADTEGDEFLKVYCSNLPADVTVINNNYLIKILDNDVVGSAWGTPLNATYGIVSSTAAANYYSSLTGYAGQDLKMAIQSIIADPNVVRAQNYGDVWEILKEADQDPSNNMAVWLLYTEQGRSKSLQQTSTTSVGTWNREHIYPQSRGGFTDGTSFTPDGINIYMSTSADHREHGHSDAHALRASDYTENSIRSNKDYGEEYNGPLNNHGSWKGDVARSIFYMTIRYNGLNVVSGNPDNSTVGQMGDLDSLIVWHRQDPPDDFEMNRNNIIYNWQKNRNPFIDLPELAEYLWGTKVGQYWNSSVGINDVNYTFNEIVIYPNPVVDQLKIKNIEFGEYQIFNILGEMMVEGMLKDYKIDTDQLNPGLYFLEVKTSDKFYRTKFIKN